jgi:hypothetical protein
VVLLGSAPTCSAASTSIAGFITIARRHPTVGCDLGYKATRLGPCPAPVWSLAMGAIKPWHLFLCLIVVMMIIGLAAAISAGRRK